MKKTQSEQYCQDLLLLDIYRYKATANAVISLSSYREGDHFVDSTLSPLYHHQYSSLTASVSLMTAKLGKSNTAQQVRKLLYKYIGKKSEIEKYYVLQTDTTGMERLYSPKMAGRKVIYNSQNKILSNKPISIGHEVSYINLSKEGWSIPLSVARLETNQTAIGAVIKQLSTLLGEEDYFLSNDLIVNTLDSKYGIAQYLCEAFGFKNLVSLARLSSSRKVYFPSIKTDKKTTGYQVFMVKSAISYLKVIS